MMTKSFHSTIPSLSSRNFTAQTKRTYTELTCTTACLLEGEELAQCDVMQICPRSAPKPAHRSKTVPKAEGKGVGLRCPPLNEYV